ncbi:unnamed protein product [Diabrotica balteata]|uniref:Carboxylesterase type B domain-containing protein n=1 Tax=Diabrotica balteata TaxID=107213 RepID=A0A9N9XEZ0_DIABA|nr:unnamed protein product [Diabrotica balteata]
MKFLIYCVLLVFVVLNVNVCGVIPFSTNELIVDLVTPKGKILGHTLQSFNGNEYYAFQEIPYAAPPIGNLRYQATVVNEIENNPLVESQRPSTPKACATPTIHSEDPRIKKKSKKTIEAEPLEDVALRTAITHFAQIGQQNDEFEAFGSSVAAQLRALPIIDALELQMELQQLITQKRIKLLRKTPSAPSPYASNQSPLSSNNEQLSSVNSPYSTNEYLPSQSPFPNTEDMSQLLQNDQHQDILSESLREADISDAYTFIPL